MEEDCVQYVAEGADPFPALLWKIEAARRFACWKIPMHALMERVSVLLGWICSGV
jgi:hypothetical protein